MTESTDNTPKMAPPDLPTDTHSTKPQQTSSYSSVTGSSQSVASTRYNPINQTEKPLTSSPIPTTTTTAIDSTSNHNKKLPHLEQEEKEYNPSTSTPTTTSISGATAITAMTTNNNNNNNTSSPPPKSTNADNSSNATNNNNTHNANNNNNSSSSSTAITAAAQQQLLAAQQAMAASAAAQQSINPMLAAQVAMLQQQQYTNKYQCWPPLSHPYQINNYLARSPMNGNMSVLGGAGLNNPLSLLTSFNPLIAASTGSTQSAAATAATAAMLGGGGGGGVSGGGQGGVSGGTQNGGGKQHSLFVFHLPEDIDDNGLLQLFAIYGAMGANVMRHDTGTSRGFGFVSFNTRHQAQIAIDMMNGYQIGRKRLRVSFKREENHNKIRTNLNQ